MNEHLLIGLGALALSLVSVVAMAQPAGFFTTNAMVPVNVTLPSATDRFAIDGTLHVVAHVDLSGTVPVVNVHANLLDTTGVSLSSGETFIVTLDELQVSEDSLEFIVALTSRLLESDGQNNIDHLHDTLQALLKLHFDEVTGRLIDASIVSPICDLCG